MDLQQTYNRIAEDWHRDHSPDDWWKKGADKFASFLKRDDRVLDVGCGTGLKSRHLIEKGLKITGIDFSEKMVEIARRENPSGEFIVCDLKEVHKLEYLFDGIFMQAVLLHIPKKEISENLEQIMGKLKNGGYLYVAVKEKKLPGKDEEVKIENDYGYSYQRFFSYFTAGEVESYLKKAGLKIVFSKVISFGNTNWIQAIGRK